MELTRSLSLQTPPLSGDDVAELQKRLIFLGYTNIGGADGVFGSKTDKAIRAFQNAHQLTVDGIVGSRTWKALFKVYAPPSFQAVLQYKADLIVPHGFRDSIAWQLGGEGILIEGQDPEVTRGEPLTVKRVWENYGQRIEQCAEKYGVPVELIMATICTETSGRADAVRQEPGYISDEQTPHKVSPGIMQTLISTARLVMGDDTIDRAWLLNPDNAIEAGTAYMAKQRKSTLFDPPKVACAYNAGGIYHNKGEKNRWKMRQYPLGSGEHADRFVKWFNDCFRFFNEQGIRPASSYYMIMNEAEMAIA